MDTFPVKGAKYILPLRLESMTAAGLRVAILGANYGSRRARVSQWRWPSRRPRCRASIEPNVAAKTQKTVFCVGRLDCVWYVSSTLCRTVVLRTAASNRSSCLACAY